MSDQTQVREPTYSATAAKIISTARSLFMQRGYRAVSINDIVSAAEITKPTLYYHFADKEELFVQMALHTLAQMRDRMTDAAAGGANTAERLASLAREVTRSSDGDTAMMRHEIREHLSPAQQVRIAHAFEQHMIEPLRAVMRQGLADGELVGRTEDELAWIFLHFMEGFHGGMESADAAPAPEGVPGLRFSAETLIDIFLHGVGPRT
jgi:AcrR family transcriptional regulator